MGYNYQDAPRESQQEYFGKVHTDNKETLKNALKRIEELEKHNAELLALINAERERQEKCNDIHLRTIADLEKENAELKKFKQDCETSICRADCQYNYEQLTKAKEIIREYMRFEPMIGTCSFYSEEYEKTKKQAENFLKE